MARAGRFTVWLTLAVLLAMPGAARAQAPPDVSAMDGRFEQAVLGGRRAPGKLVAIDEGTPGQGVGVVVHGINSHTSDIAPLLRALSDRALLTTSFVYDDEFRTLRESADDLAAELAPYLAGRPGEPLVICAHSMGARIALAALDKLGRDGALTGRRVTAELVAPVLQGFALANLARWTPAISKFKNGRPGLDLGTRSAFQRELESLVLPPQVSVRVFLGEQDRVVPPRNGRLWRVIAQIHASVVRLARADHLSAVAGAAAMLRAEQTAAAGLTRAN